MNQQIKQRLWRHHPGSSFATFERFSGKPRIYSWNVVTTRASHRQDRSCSQAFTITKDHLKRGSLAAVHPYMSGSGSGSRCSAHFYLPRFRILATSHLRNPWINSWKQLFWRHHPRLSPAPFDCFSGKRPNNSWITFSARVSHRQKKSSTGTCDR